MIRSKAALAGLFSVAASLGAGLVLAGPAPGATGSAKFTTDGQLAVPQDFRNWSFIGAMVTPNGLNGGKAGFPEFHNVYVERANLDAYRKTGKFPEGTVIVKELTKVRDPSYPDGSTDEASGRGFFEGELSGLDVMVKDGKRFSATGGWGFFNFGHNAPPYAKTAKAMGTADCAGCHKAGASKSDMVFVQFYPNLRAKH
jgi:hypothetical protein